MFQLKIIFQQQIQLKWNHCLQRIKMLNIYNVSVKDNISAADSAEMESLSSKNKNVKYL